MLQVSSWEGITGVAVHHTGGLASDRYAKTAGLTLRQVDNAHFARWPDFKSELGYYVGYTVLIFPDGSYVQTRKIGEETAAQVGHNFDTVAICLLGNFLLRPDGTPVESPTEAQKKTLHNMLFWILENSNVQPGQIWPHRLRTVGLTECYGYLSDSWARDLVFREYFEKRISLLRQILSMYYILLDIRSRLRLGVLAAIGYGGGERTCGPLEIKVEEIALI